MNALGNIVARGLDRIFLEAWMDDTQRRLVACGVLLIAVVSVVVPAISNAAGFLFGYVGVLAIYWVFFCIPVAVKYAGRRSSVSYSLKDTPILVIVLALALPVAVFFAAGTASALSGNLAIVMLAVVVGLIKGPLEELAWRRAYRANSNDSPWFELFGVCMFTLWHIPLLLHHGVTYDFGVVGLVGGVFFMGLIWSLLTRATGSVGWPMISHALVNIAAFIPFFAMNAGM